MTSQNLSVYTVLIWSKTPPYPKDFKFSASIYYCDIPFNPLPDATVYNSVCCGPCLTRRNYTFYSVICECRCRSRKVIWSWRVSCWGWSFHAAVMRRNPSSWSLSTASRRSTSSSCSLKVVFISLCAPHKKHKLLQSVLFFSRPRSEGWPHHGRTFSIYPCPLSFWLTLPRESCPRLDVVHPGRAWPSSPSCTWHCSLHYLFLQATPLFPHGVTIVC